MPPGPQRTPGAAEPLWASGRFVLRVHGVGSNWRRQVEVRRPFALIGRVPGSDVLIDDRDVNSRHVYLHLDRRGLFAVDLASRTGSRIGPEGRSAAWLAPGDLIEVAGRRIELLSVEVDRPEPGPGPGDDPLSDTGGRPMVGVTLFPAHSPDAPLVLNSELVFLGRSAACGVQVDVPAAARIQCALVRSERVAYAVDLLGRIGWVNGRPLREAVALHDGDLLGVGSARFECRIQPFGAGPPAGDPPAREPAPIPGLPAVRPSLAVELLPDLPDLPPLPPELIAPENQGQALAWMMGVLQATQSEMFSRQAQFQSEVVRALRQLQADSADALGQHLEKFDALNRELSSLREEIRRRFGPSAPRPPRPEPPKPPPLRLAPPPSGEPPTDPGAAAAWILNRVSQIDQESRNTWKDLLGRLGRNQPGGGS